MKKRARIVSGLAALAALFRAPLAEASLTRSSAPAREAPVLALTLAAPEPSEFSLFDGTELARALASRPALISIYTDEEQSSARTRFVSPSELSADELPEGPELVPITSVREQRFNLRLSPDVFGLEPLRGPPGDEASYPKTRYRVFGLLGTTILGELRGVSLELHWGSASFSRGLASGTVGWLSQDPLEDRDSPNLYGFVGARPHEKTDPLGLQSAPAQSPYCQPGVAADPDLAAFMCGVTQREGGLSSPAGTAGAARIDQASLAKAWAAWKQAPERGRQAGREFWRYEPQVTPLQREVGGDWGAEAAKRGGEVMGDITGGAVALTIEVGETVVETEVGGRLVRAVVGAGGRVVRILDDLGPASGPGKYVARNETMSAEAKAYEEAVAHGRPGQAYRVPYENPNPRGRPYVHFDGVTETGIPIDSKLSVVTRPKTADQARRQAGSLRQAGTIGIWKVTSVTEAGRARAMITEAGASDVIRIIVEAAP